MKGQSDNANVTTDDTCIFWINGSAGTGKTTIAYTIAEDCRKHQVLGASFFCSRDDSDCSSPGLIFTTIAYQLGQFSALYRAEVTRALQSNPDIGYSSVPYQLEQLIVNPLRTIRGSFPPCVVYWMRSTNARTAGPHPSSCLHSLATSLNCHHSSSSSLVVLSRTLLRSSKCPN
jgi:Cytidylate kinase